VEGAGEDPYLGAAMAAAYVRGYQGEKLNHPDSLAACAKHYVGYGAAEAGRDYNSADISERTLREIYLPPFAAAVGNRAATVMSAFNSLNAVPASANPTTLTTILRQEWGFSGFVVSDWGSVGELIPMGAAENSAAAATKALLAGVDMDMESGTYAGSVAALVRSGALPEAAVDQAVRRVLRVKFALGLFEHPYVPEGQSPSSPSPADLALAATIAEHSLVLLKNDPVKGAPLLPLAPAPRTLALVGPLADSAADMLGSWPGKGEARNAVTLKSALEQRMQPGRLYYGKGTDIQGNSDAGFKAALDAARQADVTIVALGEDAQWMTAEAASRTRLGLPGNQQQLLEALAATGKPLVLVVFSGRPLALPWAATHLPAMVQAWYPGLQAGPALARVLFGEANFSGKLTVSVPRSVGQEPLYYNALRTGRPADGVDLARPPASPAEKYVSRYIDELNAPLFPFGYGLSYTRFAYSSPEIAGAPASAKELNAGTGAVRVSATVTNSGAKAGREIVQLYAGLRGTSVVRPVKELKGFRILELAPGESRKVEFTLGRHELAFWNIEMRYTVEPALVTVWIAPDSATGQAAQFRIGP
jgi:beta-glucosidase